MTDRTLSDALAYANLPPMIDLDTACDMLREMPRAQLEAIVEATERTAPSREFWRFMHGPLHQGMFEREEELLQAARAILADPGVLEHIARLKAEIQTLRDALARTGA